MSETTVSAVRTATRLYEPLPPGHIRLLHLEGLCMAEVAETGKPDFAIQCRLEPVPFKSVTTEDSDLSLKVNSNLPPPSYTALSYCWGNTSPAFGRLVVCNGVTVTITSNLFDALHQFVLDDHHDKKTLWVDALCINQDDLSEKSYQVAMMGDIYCSASLVLAWLGTGSDSKGDSLCQFWKATDDHPIPDSSDDECIKSELQPRPKRRQTNRNETYTGPSLAVAAAAEEEGRRYVESSSWFKRSWTFQEAVLAREMLVQCGRFCMPWKTFCSIEGINILCENMNKARETENRQSLLDLLLLTRDRDATDLRDKVYSLLGLYQGSRKLRADYSLPVRRVHAMAMKAIVDEQGYLFFLNIYFSTLEMPIFYEMFQYLVRPHDRVLASRHFGPKAVKARGFSWIPNWSQSSSRSFKLTSTLPFCERKCVDFSKLDENWAMDCSLRGSRLCVAGALLGIKFEGGNSNEVIHCLGRPCTSLVHFQHLLTDLDKLKSGWLQNVALQDDSGFFDINKVYEATVFSHPEGTCSCPRRRAQATSVRTKPQKVSSEDNALGEIALEMPRQADKNTRQFTSGFRRDRFSSTPLHDGMDVPTEPARSASDVIGKAALFSDANENDEKIIFSIERDDEVLYHKHYLDNSTIFDLAIQQIDHRIHDEEYLEEFTNTMHQDLNVIGRREIPVVVVDDNDADDAAKDCAPHENELDAPPCFGIPNDPYRKQFVFVAILFGCATPVMLKPHWDPRKREVTFALAGFVTRTDIQTLIQRACGGGGSGSGSGRTANEGPPKLERGNPGVQIMFRSLSWIPTRFELV